MNIIKMCLFLSGALLTSSVYAQDNNSDSSLSLPSLSPETVQSIRTKIANNYRIPLAYLPDSVSTIRLQVKFTVDQYGSIKDPVIIKRNLECKACEEELKRVVRALPAIDPVSSNGKAQVVYYTLPFVIQLQ